jgi:hypothetical protein
LRNLRLNQDDFKRMRGEHQGSIGSRFGKWELVNLSR